MIQRIIRARYFAGVFYTTMRMILALVAAVTLALPGSAQVHSTHLKRVKAIGSGRNTEKWAWMSFVEFNQEGTMVASDAATNPQDVAGDLTLWSFPAGRLIRKVPGRPVAISSDWSYFATPNSVIEVQTGRSVVSLDQNDFAGFAFSPDSQFVAEASTRQHSRIGVGIHVLDLRDGTEVISFGKHSPQAVAMSSDGKTLAAGYWNAIALWNFHTGTLEAILPGIGRYVRGLAFSKDGRLLAAGTDTGALQIWDVNRRALLHSIEIGGGDVSNPAFSPDGRLVAIGIYGTGTVFLIHVGSGKVIDQQKISDLGCGSVAFSPDGKYLIAPSSGGLVVRQPSDRGGTVRVFEVVAPN